MYVLGRWTKTKETRCDLFNVTLQLLFSRPATAAAWPSIGHPCESAKEISLFLYESLSQFSPRYLLVRLALFLSLNDGRPIVSTTLCHAMTLTYCVHFILSLCAQKSVCVQINTYTKLHLSSLSQSDSHFYLDIHVSLDVSVCVRAGRHVIHFRN